MKRPSVTIKAFSLVEVVLSLGIISFAFAVIIALFPVGMKSNRDSIEESRAMNLLQAMIADWQVTAWSSSTNTDGSGITSPVYNLPNLNQITTTTSNTNSPTYVAEDGTTNSSPAGSFYRTTYTIYPSAGYMQPAYVDMTASWPAAATNAPSSVEVLTTFLQ
jgi:type II secretory pathway pseudopilin PulG